MILYIIDIFIAGCVDIVTHNLEITNVTLCKLQVSTHSPISWREQVTFRRDDDDVHVLLD